MRNIDEWFGSKFGCVWSEGNWGKEYRYETDYENCVWDSVTVWNDGKVDYSWEDLYWGGRDYKSESFKNVEDFIEFYENLKEY